MAGQGPAPKPAGRRARKNADPVPQTILRKEVAPQPDLPPMPGGFDWCEQTLAWWKLWGESSQAEHFSTTDWSFLVDTALIHQDVWAFGNLDRMPELRLRVAKFGATLEDRARLRMQFAEADGADARRPAQETSAGQSARERWGVRSATVTDINHAVDPARKNGELDGAPAKAPAKKRK